jgi:mRNA interferase YafQ
LKILKTGKPSKLKVIPTVDFKSDVKRMKKRGKSLNGLKKVIDLLANEKPLSGKYKDHELEKEWAGHRDCHIEADWVLIYKIKEKILILERTGTHEDLFRK